MREPKSGDYRGGDRETQVEREAQRILNSVGLTWEDVKAKNAVVDWGAGSCNLALTARKNNESFVISVDKKFPDRLRSASIRLVYDGNTQSELSDSSADLIISKQGPLFVEPYDVFAMDSWREMNRVVTGAGEIRVFPNRLGFIETELAQKYPDFHDAKAKAPTRRTLKDLQILKKYRTEAASLSEERLRYYGIKFSTQTPTGPTGLEEENLKFWILNKKVE